MQNFHLFFILLKSFLGEVYGDWKRGVSIYQSKYRAIDYYRNYKAKRGSYLIVLTYTGEPKGFLYGRSLKGYSYIYDIFVCPSFRGMGLGYALVKTFSVLSPPPYRADVSTKALNRFLSWGFKELNSYIEDGVKWHLIEASTL